jgi:4-hydroxy-tetrahydrodipicolinate synthase
MTANRIDQSARGVYVIAATPFTAEGAVDHDSTRRLVDFYLSRGADGLTALGMMGEQQKLSPEESFTFVETFLKRVDARVPVIVGAATPWLDNLKAFAARMMDLGAAAIMVAPMQGLRSDEQIYNFFNQVCSVLDGIPVVLQDYPQTTGVYMAPSLISRMIDEFDNIVMFKHEDYPGLAKLSTVRRHGESKGRRVPILVGNGAIHYPQELARGADGAMTGFSFPEMTVDVYELWRQGKSEEAETLYDAYLPMVRHELQPGMGLAIRKYVLARRGAIATDHVRLPGPKLSAEDKAEIDHLIRRLERRLAELGRQLKDMA